MDFRHLIVTCLFSKLRLPFDNQKVKENYAILLWKGRNFSVLYIGMMTETNGITYNSVSL